MTTDYDRIRDALQYIEARALEQPGLQEVASHMGLSPFHFQRLFRRWAGVSPKRFLQLVTVEHAKRALESSRTTLDAAYDAGLSSPGRLHDLMVTLEAATPGEYRSGGRGVEIVAAVHDSPFGHCLVAVTARGVCGLSFHDDPACGEGYERLRKRWPAAEIGHDRDRTAEVPRRLFGSGAGVGGQAVADRTGVGAAASAAVVDGARQGGTGQPAQTLALHVRGTNFQVAVWRALLDLAPGQLTTYGDVAVRIGRPRASRAVGSAVGANPVAWLIPCHRVITSLGTFGHYRWGPERKRAMIGWEVARRRQPT